MNGYEKAQSLGLVGESEIIVNKLKTLTQFKIPIPEVIQFFDEQDLAKYDPLLGDWIGSLIELARSPETPSLMVSGLHSLFIHLNKRTSETIDTTNLTIAEDTWSLMNSLLQMSLITTGQRDSFYSLGNNFRPYSDLTVEQYDGQVVAAEKDAVVSAVVQKANNAKEAAEAESRRTESNEESIWAAANAAWEA